MKKKITKIKDFKYKYNDDDFEKITGDLRRHGIIISIDDNLTELSEIVLQVITDNGSKEKVFVSSKLAHSVSDFYYGQIIIFYHQRYNRYFDALPDPYNFMMDEKLMENLLLIYMIKGKKTSNYVGLEKAEEVYKNLMNLSLLECEIFFNVFALGNFISNSQTRA